MEKILGEVINKSCLKYVDDIMILAETFDNLFINLNGITAHKSSEGASIELEKTRSLAEEIDFPGHTIGKNRMMAMSRDVSAI
jgi:hypothetical protein